MLKRTFEWKRLFAIIMVAAMLFTNNCGVFEVFAEGEEPTTNLQVNADIIVNNDNEFVKTGEQFRYQLQYTVPELKDSEYTGAFLTFTLPEYVVLTTDSNGDFEIKGEDFDNVTYNDLTNEYTVYFKSPLTKYKTNTLTIEMKTENLITPNDLVLDFNTDFTFQTQFVSGGESKTQTIAVQAGTVKTYAESIWEVTKENITSEDGLNYKKTGTGADAKFEVTYRVEVKDTKGVDRLGRLGFETYQVIDTLPKNLPAGGEALEIKDVKLVRGTGAIALTDAEYSVTSENGSPVSITFKTYDVIKEGDVFGEGETSQYLKPGDTTDTTYEYTVVYPYNPYTTSGDKIDPIAYELVNTAVLDYKLVGKEKATDSDDAKTNISAFEENVVKADVSVEKYIQFENSDPEILDADTAALYGFTGANAVKFTLYTDEQCTNVAYNTKTIREPMSNIGINENGVATFEAIRKGTYYIKEVSTHAGWTNAPVITVVIDDNGNVEYPGMDKAYKAINLADTINAVEFTKSGLNAYGETDNVLAGATFTLTNTATSKTYTATSDANGRVRFDNIPSGNYTLVETAITKELQNKGYEVSATEYSVEVSGGKVVTPEIDGGNNFVNLSHKGLLEITKVDAENPETKLSGAVFELHGPYESGEAANADKDNPSAAKAATLTTGSNGKATSGPLKQGFYVLVETKAPVNYTAGEAKVVKVEERTKVVEDAITNNPQAKVYFSKKGAKDSDRAFIQELAGTQFEIYDASGNRLYGVKDGDGNYKDVSTDSTGRTAVTITTELDSTGKSVSNYVSLSPGTYLYKETVTPSPFVAEKVFVEFQVAEVAPAAGSSEWNITQTNTVYNYLEYGQIRIVKTTNDTPAVRLNDAVFGVYASYDDAESGENPVDTITTGTLRENGEEVEGIGYTDVQLQLGKTYYVKEIDAPDGFAVNPQIHQVTLNAANKQVTLDCVNDRTVSIQIQKIDSVTKNTLRGAKFALYSAQNDSSKIGDTKTTGSNGTVTFDNLDPNKTYYYKEIAAPSGYVIQDTGFKAVRTNATGVATVEVKNDRQGDFKLSKQLNDGSPLNNITFRLFNATSDNILTDTNNLATSKVLKTGKTDSNGDAAFNNLNPGDYWLVETVEPAYVTGENGEVLLDDWKVLILDGKEYFYKKITVVAGQNKGTGYSSQSLSVTNTPTKGRIEIKKFEAKADGTASTTTINNVQFKIYTDAACTNAVDTLKTANGGKDTSIYLAPGDYYIKETVVPSGYIISDTVYKVTVEAGMTTTTGTADGKSVNLLTDIANAKKGTFTVNKVAAYNITLIDGQGVKTPTETTNPLTGASFTLYKYENNTKGAQVATIDLSASTSGRPSDSLEPGVYLIEETTVPDGYVKAADNFVQVGSDGSVMFGTKGTGNEIVWDTTNTSGSLTVKNSPEKSTVVVIKKDYYSETRLQGAEFAVYKEADNGTETDVDGDKVKLVRVTDANGNPLTLTTDANGEAVMTDVEDGTYYFKETKAPDGYYFNPNDVWMSVVVDNGEYRVVFVNFPEAEGIKYNANETKRLPGATIAVFTEKVHAEAILSILKGETAISGNNYHNEYDNPLTLGIINDNKAAWNIDQVVTSDKDGVFKFTGLIPGETYYIVELIAPTVTEQGKEVQYQLDYEIYTVVVATNAADKPFSAVYKGDVKQNGHALAIYNALRYKVKLYKKYSLSNSLEYFLGAAKFHIYPATKDAQGNLIPNLPKGELMTEYPTGQHESTYLPAGTYFIAETEFPNGFSEAGRTLNDFIIYNDTRYYKVELGRTGDNTDLETNPVYNVNPKGVFALTKISSTNASTKLVATFNVSKVDGNDYTLIGTITTDDDGYVLSNELEPGLYMLTEEKAPAGYTKNTAPIYIRVAANKVTDGSVSADETVGGETVSVYQPVDTASMANGKLSNSIKFTNAPQGEFRIYKFGTLAGAESKALSGVKFEIYKKTAPDFANEPETSFVKEITTNSNGYAKSGKLDAGDYWVIESGFDDSEMNAEYGKDSYTARSVTVTAGQTATNATIRVENTSNLGRFKVKKVDSVTGSVIKNVTFTIYSDRTCNTAVGTMTPNNDGTYTSPKLQPGNYWLKETSVPDDYTINLNKVSGWYTVTANTVAGGTTPFEIENEHDKSLTVKKYSMYENADGTIDKTPGANDTKVALSGAQFELYQTYEAGVLANKVGDTKTTGTNGTVVWTDLEDGVYYLKEITAPSGHLLQKAEGFVATPNNPAPNIYFIVITGQDDNNSFDYAFDVYNLEKGGFKLDKVIVWDSGNIVGDNITFELRNAANTLITTLTTDSDGKISYEKQLPAGDYVLVEQSATLNSIVGAYNKPAPRDKDDADGDGNFIDEDGNIHIRVVGSETNEFFTEENAIQNTANFGRFILFKKAYTKNDQLSSVGLNGAQYQLQKFEAGKDGAEDSWTDIGTFDVNDATVDGHPVSGMYVSGAMVPGKYRVIEIAPPTSIQNSNGNQVVFTVDPTPIEFEIKAATTVEKTQYDGIYRNLVIHKTADQKNDYADLQGVTFELYKAKADAVIGEYVYDGNLDSLAQYKDSANPDRIGQPQTTASNGVATFNTLAPGKYLLVETGVPNGYTKKAVVLEIDASLSYLDIAHEYDLSNESIKGRILICKEDTSGNLITKNNAENAQFAIYAEADTELTNPLCTVSVDNTGYGQSELLESGKNYWVVETKAPNGYTLDDRLLPLKKLVTVTGDQNPVVDFAVMDKTAVTGYVDGVIFQNRTQSNTGSVYSTIKKLVRLTGENEFKDDFTVSENSLMFQNVTAEFRITNLFDRTKRNEIPFTSFTVIDETMKFMDKNGVEIEELENPDADDYVMNYIKVGKAINKDTSKVVSAEVFAKVGTEWQSVVVIGDITNISEPVKVDLPENTIGFKVEYYNTDVGFSPEDIDLGVTFKQRPSDATVAQVREIENMVVLNWEDTSLNEEGEADHQTGSTDDVAAVKFPAYDEKIPTLALKNDIVNPPSGGMYYSGGTIDFKTVGSVPATSPADLDHPVMSINLPPYTSLDTTKYSELDGGINGIRATLKNGTVCKFKITKLTENNELGQPYEKYVLDFGKDFVLPKDESITLEYTANISLDVPDTTIFIESHGFIGSAKQLPLTEENPTGRSYRQAESDGSTLMTGDNGFDSGLKDLENEIVGDKLTYLRRPVNVKLTRTDSRLIRKYVSVDGENWLTTETPVVKPGDNYYYKLTMVNAGDPVRRIRMIDILPFAGDTHEFRATEGGTIMNRTTNLPSGFVDEQEELVYEQVQLVAVTPDTGDDMKVTVYYYVESEDVTKNVADRDWTAANRGLKTAVTELPMLTSNAPASEVWTGNWTTVAPADMRSVTAIGIEVEYLNNKSLSGGGTYNVEITMRAPGYTAEHMNDYADAIIANTTAATVTRVGADDTSAVTAIDRVASNEVHTKLYITTGAIGDYAFYDNNDNGIQDEGDIPARNIPVTLYRRKTTTDMEADPVWEEYATTYTDQTTGKYWFDELPCNYLIPGLDTTVEGFDPTDPANYIGNTYFEYQVEFGIPDGYAATIREAGEDRAVDSNINEFGVTDPVTLALTLNADGKLEGEINPTIDAGYVRLVNLGDYVWVDYNKNGVQDESEPGVNDTTVNLYKLESAEDTIEGKTPYRTQLTATKDGKDGYYLFSDLPKGYYVVEFDLTTVEKDTGYTTQYAFTVNDAGSDGADSDAAFVKDENDQIMYTEVIHLTEDDMTWDAGVTVYSALGGFVFDDQDYNDTQSIPTEVDDETTANGIPLPGTVVTLYKVNEDGSMDPEPIGEQTVGEDGRYFFDHLEAGRYKVHFDYPDEYIGVKEGVGDYLHDSETKFFDDSTLNSGFTDIIELPVDTADLTHDAGAYLVSSIGDYVWEDIDRDGIQDEGEEPVKDITVTLQQKLGDGEWTTIETTTTDENGLYLFEGLKSSDHYDVQYRVAFAIPLTVELTGDNIGDNRAEDSNALPTLDAEYGYFTNEVKPPYGEDDLTIDAGLYYKDDLCEVGDYVWYDANKDGIQDKEEKGVEGIVVILERCESENTWNEEAWKVVAETKTDANGKYIFKGLQPGRYRVAFGLSETWIVTIPRVGDAALDSDAIRQSKDYYYTSAFFLNAGDSDMTWDAGIYEPTIVVVPPENPPEVLPENPPEVPPVVIPITGDNANIVVWMAMLLSSMIMLVFLSKKLKKVKKETN